METPPTIQPTAQVILPDPQTQAAIASDVVSLYMPILASVGSVILLVAWLPLLIRRMPLSLPIVCVLLGAAAFSLTPFSRYTPHPVDSSLLVEKAAEMIVIVSLMGAGLKISRPLGWRNWRAPLMLIVAAMPLTIVAFALLGHALLGLGLAAALLLGASLAPTDPVLASDIQIEQPRDDAPSEARFVLTAEGGLNDSLAFPFVHLAVALSLAPLTGELLSNWLWDDLALRLAIGLVVGVASGWALGYVIYRLPSGTRLSRTGDGFVALGATLLVYAGTELLHGYGFLAVFVAGVVLRRSAGEHDFNERLHAFADETERLLMMVMLVFFGGMLATGGLLVGLTVEMLIFVVLALLVIRPLIGWVSLRGAELPGKERLVIAVFGIRGLGSVYYLAFGLNHGAFAQETGLWQVLALTIAVSILIHGISATPAMAWLERSRNRRQKSLEV